MQEENRYLEFRQQLKLKGTTPAKEVNAEKKAKAKFFGDAIKDAPRTCQECDDLLIDSMIINSAAVVAHIIAKGKTGGCPSVATAPLNKIYLCNQCHHSFDNKGEDHIIQMKTFSWMRDRVKQFYNKIAKNELPKVPYYFRPENKEFDRKTTKRKE